ncbi:pyocin knob domain-containing protein [Clostridium chrysemydis]|uniref:pyocin knob domain-containing protein n=1 Tax=Clostridium chrysemydis TaxID=2665504 RepID=UPI001884762A|nr:pyocin knob domain-containing protein [Clostridium chrysemydis]
MDKFKTNWQLTETVKPEDFNRIEGNIKENDTELSKLEENVSLELNKRDKEINKKSQKSDVILKVEIPNDRDCNSFKSLNSFCAFDTGIGDFKNTPEGTLPIGSSKVFIITNRGYSNGRIQQEFTYLYPKERVTKWVRNYDSEENEKWGKWYKIYDESNKPTADDLGVSPNNHNHDSDYVRKRATRIVGKDLNEIIDGGYYAIVQHEKACPNIPVGSDGYLMVIPWSGGQWCTQIFINDIEGDMHIRTNNISSNGMSWSKWAKVYDTNNKPTPGEIGAYSKDETDNKFKVKDATVFTLQDSYVAVRTSNRKPNQYYEFWDTNSGWADLKCNDVFVGQGRNKVYHSGNKPTPSDIGAVSKTGDNISGTLKFKSAGNEIEIFNSGATPHARGVVYKNDSNVITGMVGSLLNGQNSEKMFIGNTSEPWSGVNSLTVDKGGCYYNNQKIYHKGNKPTPGEIGAVSTSDISQEIVTNKVVQRDSNGDIKGRLLRSTYQDESYVKGAIAFRTNNSDDNYTRYCNNPTALKQWLGFGQWDFNTRDLKVHNKRAMVGLDNNDGNKLCINYNEDFENVDISGKITLGGMRVGNGYENGYRKSIPVVAVDGVMEVGRFIDFHSTTKEKDYDVRMECAGPNDLRTSGSFSAVGGDIYAYKGGSGNTKAAILGTGDMDIFVCNLKSKKYLQLKDDGRLCYSDIKIQLEPNQGTLWSGVQYMGSGQSAWPSRHLMDCQNGWILVWSDYDQGPNNANDYNWCYSYIPKNSPANGKAQNQFFQVSTNENGDMTVKGLIIYNNRIDGVDPTGNAQSSGKWHDVVLRYVLEY